MRKNLNRIDYKWRLKNNAYKTSWNYNYYIGSESLYKFINSFLPNIEVIIIKGS